MKIKLFNEISKKYGSQRAAADALGVSTAIYSEWANGIKSPSPANINKLAQELGSKPGDLFERIHPRTEYTKETRYAELLEAATNGEVQAGGLRP